MKKWIVYIPVMLAFFLLAACSAGKENLKKIRDIDYTVVAADEVPEELKVKYEEEKEHPCRLTYADQGYLYIAQGYGKKETSGYSASVEACYETEDAVCIETSLMGPDRKEEIIEEDTYPYVVVKIEYTDKNVIFQ